MKKRWIVTIPYMHKFVVETEEGEDPLTKAHEEGDGTIIGYEDERATVEPWSSQVADPPMLTCAKDKLKPLTIENHRNCPRCGSPNTKVVTDHGRCLCGGDCWSHPECSDCGYQGYMNSEGIFWHWDGPCAEPKPSKIGGGHGEA